MWPLDFNSDAKNSGRIRKEAYKEGLDALIWIGNVIVDRIVYYVGKLFVSSWLMLCYLAETVCVLTKFRSIFLMFTFMDCFSQTALQLSDCEQKLHLPISSLIPENSNIMSHEPSVFFCLLVGYNHT
jgi:hypothetical protein